MRKAARTPPLAMALTGPAEPNCLRELIESRRRESAGAVAILSPGRRALTYGRLGTFVEEVSLLLHRAGLGREDSVAISLPNGPEAAVAFLCVSTVAPCAPLNPAYRLEESGFFLEDLRAHALIVAERDDSPARLAALRQGIPILELSFDAGEEAGIFRLAAGEAVGAGERRFAAPEDVALLLHTSGTTSRPKLVPLTHANLCSSARNVRDALALTASDRCLNVMPLFHIHGLVGALLSSLTAGGSVVCAPGFYAPQFFEWIEASEPTWYTAVPTMHQAILERAASHRETIARRPLRFIRSSSAALPPQAMVELETVFGVPVIESYGMTEASHQMASNPLPPRPRKPGSVGIAAGPEIAILGEAGDTLPAGRPGEVAVRGTNVTRGYEKNPAANEQALLRGWFRTGDQGFLDADGYLFLTGRLKELINRGGEKISPREIDEALLDHPAVAQAVAFAAPDPRLGEDVAAAVVLREGAAATERELREFAANRLAAFKVPRRVLILEEIPKGPTGKLQRIGLAEKLGPRLLDPEPPTPGAGEPAPRSPLERELARIWSEVLRVERIGRETDFLALGGDSVLATQVVSRVRDLLDVELSVLQFFETPTVASLADSLEKLRRGEREEPAGGAPSAPPA